MRVRTLRLRQWGQVSGRAVTLPDGPGLDVLVGPNEAGKTTTMRAFRGLVSGIQADDAAPVKLASAELEAEVLVGGEAVAVARTGRRERGAALLDAAGREITPPGWPRLARALYDAVFCLDQHELDASGRALSRSGGSLGELFFATGVGLDVYLTARNGLQQSLDARFSPSRNAQRPAVNAAVRALREAQSHLDAQRVDTAAWDRLEQAVRDAADEHARRWQAREDARSALDVQVRAAEALPRLRALQAARARLSELDPDGTLPGLDWARDVRARIAAHDTALHEVARLARDLEETGARLLGTPDDPAILRVGEDLEGLARSLAWVRETQDGLPALERALRAAEHAIREGVEASGGTLDAGDAAAVQAWRARLPGAEAVAQARAALEAVVHLASQGAQAARDEEDARQAVEACAPPQGEADAPVLEAALEVARRFHRVRLAEARDALAARARELDAEARGMGLGDADAARLLAQRHPDDAEIQAEVDAAGADGRAREANLRDAEALTRQMEGWSRDAEVIRAAGRFVELGALHAAREHRDAGVAATLAALDGAAGALRAWAPADAGRAVRDAVRRADELADARFDHAESASRLVALDRQLGQGAERMDALRVARAALEAASVAREQAWGARLAGLGVPWQPAAGLRGWVASLHRLRDRAQALARETRELSAREAEVSEARAGLARALGVPEGHDAPLDALVARAEQVVAALREAREARAHAGVALRDAERRRARADAALADAQGAWEAAAHTVGLPVGCSHAVARQRLQTLETLRVAANDWARAAQDVQRGAEVLGGFRARLAALADLVDPALPPLVQAERLLARRASAAQQRVARASLAERLELLTRERDSHAARVSEGREALAAARARVGVAAEQSLAPWLEAVEEAHGLRERVASLARDLGGRAPALETLLEGRTEAELEAAVASARLALAEAEDAFLAAVGAEARAKTERARVDGSDAAARASEQRAMRGAELAAQVQDYLEEAVAAWILEQAIAEAQTHAEDGPLTRASDHFRTLTLGAFEGLRALEVSESGKGERYIVARRSEHDPVDVEALSDGTRDALWLALRIAAIEAHLDQEGPVPVVLDDVLVNLDDARSAAALSVLAGLAERTQVVLFTHHAHLAALASEVLGARARIHALAPRDPPVAVVGDPVAPVEARKGRSTRR